MANIAEITIENTVKESRQIINNNFANLNEGLSTAGSVKTVNNILPDDNGNITVDLGSYAPLASPALTGTPTAPTATAGTSTTQLATTAFVSTSYMPLSGGTVTGQTIFKNPNSTYDSANLGNELLSTSDTWVTTGWTGSFSAGYTHTTGNTTVLSDSTFVPVVNSLYQITITISNSTAGSITVGLGGYSQSNSVSWVFGPRASTTSCLTITPTYDFNGTIIISIRLINNSNYSILYKDSNGNNSTGKIITLSTLHNEFNGYASGYNNTTGSNNVFNGYQSGHNNTTGYCNVFSGYQSGYYNTTGYNNVFSGYLSGRYIADGSTHNTSSSYSTFIGYAVKALADGDTNEIAIGYNTIGNGSNTATWGNTSITDHYFSGTIHGLITNATNDASGNEISTTYATKTEDSAKLPLSGGTMTGALVLSGAPTADLHASTKKYVDDLISGLGGGGGSTVSITAGTISGGSTIPVPSGYTRAQCKYAVWFASQAAGGGYASVNQSTWMVACQYHDDFGWESANAGYLCVAVK